MGNTPAETTTPEIDQLLALGARARERRLALGLSAQNIANDLGVSASKITLLERQLNALRNEDFESQWEALLQTPAGWLRNIDLRAPAPTSRFTQKPVAKTVREEIISICNWLSTPEIINRTFNEKWLDPRAKMLSQMMQMRYGVHGEEKSTLEATGEHFSLTRERIRQLLLPMTKRAVGIEFDTPLLDNLKEIIQAVTPATVDNMEAATRPILGKHLGLSCANRFANDILGKSLADFTALTTRNKKFATMVTSSSADSLPAESIKLSIQASRTAVRASGAADIDQVAQTVSEASAKPLSTEALHQAIQSIAGFEWLDKNQRWFWLGSDFDTRLVRVTRKLFSACQQDLRTSDIHKGMGSNENEPIPELILLSALSRFKWLAASGKNKFRAAHYIDPAEELSAVEKAICEAIQLHNGVATKSEIDTYVGKTLDVAQVSVNVTLSKSPVLIQPGRGLYSIRGVRPQSK